MKSYTREYMRFFDYGEEDHIFCEWCGGKAVDIHHIYGRLGKNLNDVYNLIALCRNHHEDAHNEKITKGQLVEAHFKFIEEHGTGGIFE